ncbi:MAG: phosphoribosyltransferase [Firmicutes bacterium]|nr:phosphoribosyltransferase [Bacillota bacterium]
MVFVNEAWNGTGDIVVYSNYHKYWLDREREIKNPLFDVFSGKILDLKEGKDSAIRYFYNLLNEEICKGVTICVVPSSNADKKVTGMRMLGEMLAENGRDNKVYYLNREKTIEKLATGGCRGISVHMQSIDTLKNIDITGDIVLLMDDVTTTGNSLYACREILINHGAKHVEMFALGKAI